MLMERYRRKVFSIAYGMVRDPEAAMDVSQEVFIKVHRYLGSFQGTSSFYTWLYRITVNLSIDFIRKRGKRDMVDYDDMLQRREPDDIEARITPTFLDANPLKAVDRLELREQLAKAFETLTEKHRAVLLLREVEGLSYDEIARTLKVHKGTVMSRLHHARKNLQLALHDYLLERGDNSALIDSLKDNKPETSKKNASDAPGV
ncbi:MAG: sigma-70 family RNA polymerase sigma factor [Deltaproteobacteria bacterium]|nr:sigma-70 family RNA polymerase sigma factor [Deltaproteobacteria bacterium]